MRKIFALILLISMVFSLLMSCGDTTKDANTDNNIINDDETNDVENDSAEETADVKILPDIPDADFDGYEFTILVSVNGEIEMWNDFTAEEQTGDAINDAILEALAAESMNTLKPAYYDLSLKGKYVRDEESEEMLDLIFQSRIYDLGWLYLIGDYGGNMLDMLRNYRSDFTSMYERQEPAAQNRIEQINKAFSELFMN